MVGSHRSSFICLHKVEEHFYTVIALAVGVVRSSCILAEKVVGGNDVLKECLETHDEAGKCKVRVFSLYSKAPMRKSGTQRGVRRSR